MMKRAHKPLVILWILFTLFGAAPSVSAAPSTVTCGDVSISATRRGNLRFARFQCDLLGGEQQDDRITIYDLDGDMSDLATDWTSVGDLDSDVWLFDRHSDGQYDLALTFESDEHGISANIFDSRSPLQDAADSLERGRKDAFADIHPLVKITAIDGWWTHGDNVNFNLDISVDGLTDAVPNMAAAYKDVFSTDGIVDATIHIRDRNSNGRPEFDWRNLDLPQTFTQFTQRSFLMVNVRDDEPKLVPTFPWPYLGALTYGYLTSSYGSLSSPPIQVDWDTGRIDSIGEFVTSRGNDGQWFVYSSEPIEPGGQTTTTFESPFAWYDLADDRDGMPELAIRVLYYPPEYKGFLAGRFKSPYNLVRYTWDQNNDGNWDYKIGVLGKHPVDSTVAFPEFSLNIEPYDELPQWVVDNSWGPAFFVASEITPTIGEGIYTWDPEGRDWGGIEGYFAGWSGPLGGNAANSKPPSLPTGFRGDYNFTLFGQPWLYASPVDRQLHLKGATGGYWNIDGDRQMQYLDLDKNGEVDAWIVTRSGSVQSQLYRVPGGLIYSDDAGTIYADADLPDHAFTTLPPTSHEEWRRLGEEISSLKPWTDPADLSAIFYALGGTPTRIADSALTNYAYSNAGISFLVDASSTSTSESLTQFTGIVPDSPIQTVSFRGGIWSTQAATFEAPAIDIGIQPVVPFQSSPIICKVVNANSVGIEDAILSLSAVRADGASQFLTSWRLDVSPGTSFEATYSWSPPDNGDWTIRASIIRSTLDARTSASVTLQSSETDVHVSESPPVALTEAQTIGWNGSWVNYAAFGAGIILLIGLGSIACKRAFGTP